MSYSGESCLTPQGVEVVSHFSRVKLSTIVKDHCPRDPKTGDDILPNKDLDLGYSD